MRIVGPALGAGLIGVSGTDIAFLTQALCFVGAIAVVATSALPTVPRPAARAGWATIRSELADGMRIVWRTPIVRGVTATESLWTLVGAAITIAGVVLTAETLDLGDRAGLVYGLLSASMSAGAVLGALIAAPLTRRFGRPVLLALGYLGPLAIVPVLAVPPVPVLFVCWFVFGLADALAVVGLYAYLAEAVPDGQRGRMYASWNGLVTLAALASYGAVGWLTDVTGAPAMIAGSALVVGIGGPVLLVVTGALPDVLRQQRSEAVASSRP
jgi:MFS family permease